MHFPKGETHDLEKYNDYGREILLHQRVSGSHTYNTQFGISRALRYKYIESYNQRYFKVFVELSGKFAASPTKTLSENCQRNK